MKKLINIKNIKKHNLLQIFISILIIIFIIIIYNTVFSWVNRVTEDINNLDNRESKVLKYYIKHYKKVNIIQFDICHKNKNFNLYYDDINKQIISLTLNKDTVDNINNCDFNSIEEFLQSRANE
jgi:hypothetical protein